MACSSTWRKNSVSIFLGVLVCSVIIILIIFSHLCARFLGFSTFNEIPFLGFSKY
jgi:hypothetical protein